MKFCKVRDVKSPSRGTPGSAGIDFYVPNDFQRISLSPGSHISIPSGIKMDIPNKNVLIAFNKSGIATKRGLIVGACVIDEDYTGEIGIHVINVGDTIQYIEPGIKLVQFLLLPINYEQIEEMHADEMFLSKNTERGEGGFGSTGLQ